ALSTSRVGSSFCTADSKEEPPTLSPAESRNEVGLSARTVSTAQARSEAPPSAPWKSLKVMRVISSPGSAAAAAVPSGSRAEAATSAAAPRPTEVPRARRRTGRTGMEGSWGGEGRRGEAGERVGRAGSISAHGVPDTPRGFLPGASCHPMFTRGGDARLAVDRASASALLTLDPHVRDPAPPAPRPPPACDAGQRSEEHTSELQSRFDLVCRLLLEKKKIRNLTNII